MSEHRQFIIENDDFQNESHRCIYIKLPAQMHIYFYFSWNNWYGKLIFGMDVKK